MLLEVSVRRMAEPVPVPKNDVMNDIIGDEYSAVNIILTFYYLFSSLIIFTHS